MRCISGLGAACGFFPAFAKAFRVPRNPARGSVLSTDRLAGMPALTHKKTRAWHKKKRAGTQNSPFGHVSRGSHGVK